jgi:hypothetical protein
MNICYNSMLGRFEAEFHEFQGDLASVKAAGFKTDGAPAWVWWTNKVPVIRKLRENRPASGLTITPDARAMWDVLDEAFTKNSALKDEAKKLHTGQKKERKKKEQEAKTYITFHVPEGKIWVEKEDLPYKEPWVSNAAPPAPPPDLKCITCKSPVYIEFELADPPICIWCEKTLFDPHKKLDTNPVPC